jgi:8-oxo-dGTP pyrophosphatase MutT (NUDIX family)
VAWRGDALLMVHSTVAGDLKFPGGGLEPGESHADALVREVREECGLAVAQVGEPVLVVHERRAGTEPGMVLQMESRYLACEVGDEEHPRALDDYEHALGFQPVWVPLADAIRTNRIVLARGGAQPWVHRETRVLEELAARSRTPTS